MMYRVKKTWHRVLFIDSSEVCIIEDKSEALFFFSWRSATTVMRCETSHIYLNQKCLFYCHGYGFTYDITNMTIRFGRTPRLGIHIR